MKKYPCIYLFINIYYVCNIRVCLTNTCPKRHVPRRPTIQALPRTQDPSISRDCILGCILSDCHMAGLTQGFIKCLSNRHHCSNVVSNHEKKTGASFKKNTTAWPLVDLSPPCRKLLPNVRVETFQPSQKQEPFVQVVCIFRKRQSNLKIESNQN